MSWLDNAKELAEAIQKSKEEKILDNAKELAKGIQNPEEEILDNTKEIEKLTDLSIEKDPDNEGWYKIKVPQEFNKEWDIENKEVKDLFESIQSDFQKNPGMESIIKIKNNKLSLAPVEGYISQDTLEILQNLFITNIHRVFK